MSNPIKLLKKILRPLYMKYRFIKYSHIMKKTSKIEKENCILFICQYEACWNKFKNIFLKLVEKKIITYLLIVNDDNTTKEYYKKIFTEKETIFEKEFPQYCIKYKKNILKDLNPTYVIYTRPYDVYLPKDLRSYNVIKVSKTVFIPYGYTLSNNYYLYYSIFPSINYFICDDELGKNIFENFCKKNIKLGYQKALLLGFPEFEDLLDVNDDNEFKYKDKFKIIWTPRWTLDPNSFGGSNFINYYKNIFNYLIDNNDFSFLFRPHPLMFNNFMNKGIMTEDEINMIISKINSSNNTTYDKSSEYMSNFKNCDLLITDYSTIIPEYFITGNPFIYCVSGNSLNILTDNAKKMIECNYVAFNIEDVIRLINEIKVNDYKKDLRMKYINEFMNFHIGASERIVNALLNGGDK